MIQAGSVSVDVRARLDSLDRDLAQAKSSLNSFSQSGVRDLGGFTGSTEDSTKAVKDLTKALTDMDATYQRVNSSIKESQPAVEASSKAWALLGVASTGAMASFASPQAVASAAAMAATVVTVARATTALGAATLVVVSAWTLAKAAVVNASKEIDAASKAQLDLPFFIGLQKAADSTKLSLDSVIDALHKVDELTTQRIGGDPLGNRIIQLSNMGYFQGNTGVTALSTAQTLEDKFKAVVTLMDQAIAAGQRLAALDLAKMILPPDIYKQVQAYGAIVLQNLLDKSDKSKPSSSDQYTMYYAKGIALQFDAIDKRIKDSADYWTEQLNKPWLEQPSNIRVWFGKLSTYLKALNDTISTTASALRFGLMGAPITQADRLYNIPSPGQEQTTGPYQAVTGENDAFTAAAARLKRGALSPARAFPALQQPTTPTSAIATSKLTIADILGAVSPNEPNQAGAQADSMQHATQSYAEASAALKVLLQDEDAVTRKATELNQVYGEQSLQLQPLVQHIKDQTKEMQSEIDNISRSTQATTQLRIQDELLRAVKEGKLKLAPSEIAALSNEYASTMQLLKVTTELQKLKSQAEVLQLGDIGTNESAVITMLQGLFKEDWVNQLNSLPAKFMRYDQSMKESLDLTIKLREETQNFNVAMKGIGALSPEAKGQQAALQEMTKLEQQYLVLHGANATIDQKTLDIYKQLSTQAGTLATAQERFTLAEAARSRLLSGSQSIQTSQLELTLVGKSIEQQDKLRGELQARQQVETEAAAHRIKADESHITALQAQKDLEAQLKQATRESQAADDAKYTRETMFLSDTDKQVADLQKSLHGGDWSKFMDDTLAQTTRLNAELKAVTDQAGTFASTFFTELANGTKGITALTDAFKNLQNTLIDMASKQLIKQILGSSLGMFGIGTGYNPLAQFSGGQGSGGAGTLTGNEWVALGQGHTGGIVGNIPATRYVHASEFTNAPRFHSGGIVGKERPIIAMDDEEVITRNDPRHSWNGGSGGGNQPIYLQPQITVENNHSGASVSVQQESDGKGGRQARIVINEMVNSALLPGTPASRSLLSSQGQKQKPRLRGS